MSRADSDNDRRLCLPVFPLPTTVLFPGIVLPLHIFEKRYREMVADALAGDKLLAVAMIAPGHEREENPPVCEVAGAGRIIHAEKLESGRYNILLEGSYRVRLLEELTTDKLYRSFDVEVIPAPTENDAKAARAELAKLESTVMSLVSSVADSDAELVEVIRSTPDPLRLADVLAAAVVRDAITQQEILAAESLRTRLDKLIDGLAEVLVHVSEPSTTARPN